ncbi:hypothetical protein [Mycobacterium intracellulare]|uniref:hypothetical protein n=1 Tax=Mycobacterium intracellulare TaxID=1767 RepID=UPI001EEDCA92|nr:hypothetical protein [Mycobacterium intracellulare]MEE3755369.1 hypothetical protein [Mycobacterium intracellulare]
MLSDPAAAAWVALGRPAVDAPAPVAGRCGRCGQDGPTVTSSRVISEKFTAFSDWPFGTRRLCVPCAWAYSQQPTTQLAMLITTTSVTEYVNGSELTPALTAGALPLTHAALLPTARRRHILPYAQWGHLATDGLAIPWDEAAASRLTSVAWLRQTVMATWPQLGDPVPPAGLLTARPADQWPSIMAAWTSLQPWRKIPPLWATARILTNAPEPAAAR